MKRRGLLKSFCVALLLLLHSAGACAPSAVAQPNRPVGAVRVLLSVGVRDGSPVPRLRAEDVRLLEDGTPQRIVSLDNYGQSPLALALVVDVSASQQRVLRATKSIAWEFVRRLLRQDTDRVAVVSFSNETSVDLPLTADLLMARGAIDKLRFIPPPGWVGGGVIVGPPPKIVPHMAGTTALYDAVIDVSRRVFPGDWEGRRAVVLLTDGDDTGSRAKLKDAAESAVGSGVVVYAVGIGDSNEYGGLDKGSLLKITERSGGEAFFPKNMDDLPGVFARLEGRLASQYLLTFVPAGKDAAQSFHSLKIEVANPELRGRGLRFNYPEGYVSGGAQATRAK
jgi:Ca-activated chloride channel homolog